ncbi:MAG: DUF2089 domain-containing protein [Puniceicoccaceae bacterium]|nr:MAG: DUF2089 domain-containing protein [Puniceicoccaceae bacterium]
MQQTWQSLMELTRGRALVVERVRLAETGVAVEGAFELPALARLGAEDQVFVAAFVGCHGSIKEMERLFGISYPTVKNRLKAIGRQLNLVEPVERSPREEILERLERGEIAAAAALEQLERLSS